MPSLAVSGKEVLKTLLRNGFTVHRRRGSHVHLLKRIEGRTLHVTIPIHGNKDLNPFVLHSIARQAGFTWKEFQALF